MAGQLGGSGTQGICYHEDGLPEEYRGNLFFCDWGLQTIFRYKLEKAGGTFKLVSKSPFVEKGGVADFRPFSIASSHDGTALYAGRLGVYRLAGQRPEDWPALQDDL